VHVLRSQQFEALAATELQLAVKADCDIDGAKRVWAFNRHAVAMRRRQPVFQPRRLTAGRQTHNAAQAEYDRSDGVGLGAEPSNPPA
jgi:hypothetical protein